MPTEVRLGQRDVIYQGVAGFPCPNCNAELGESSKFGEQYVAGQMASCSGCRHQAEWWEIVLRSVIHGIPPFISPFNVIGGVVTAFRTTIRLGEVITIDFVKLGKPKSTLVLDLVTTGEGGMLLLEMAGNRSRRGPIPDRVTFLPVPWLDDKPCSMNILAVLSPPHAQEAVYRSLADAAYAFSQGQFREVALPAQIAVEEAIRGLVHRGLQPRGKKHWQEPRLPYAPPASHLGVTVPLLANVLGAAALPAPLNDQLRKLHETRNSRAHRAGGGSSSNTVERERAGEGLCAAAFFVAYSRLIRAKLDEALT